MKESVFQIKGQKLINSIFKINKNFKNSENEKIELQYKTDVKYTKDEKNRLGKVILKLQLFDEEPKDKQPFFIFLEIEGVFYWDESLENCDNYLKYNSPAILLSYLRSIVIQLTTMAGFPPLNIPLINFTENE